MLSQVQDQRNILNGLACCCPLFKRSYKRRRNYCKFTIRKHTASSYNWNIYVTVFVILITQITARLASKEDRLFCNGLNLLKPHQRKFCHGNVDVVRAIVEGYKNGYKQCQNAFQDSVVTGTRWNCTNTVDEEGKNSLFGVPNARPGTREASVMESFTAAGMLHNLVHKCKQGTIKACQPSLIYICPLNGHKAYTTRTACKHINWEIPMTLINRFFEDREDNIRTDFQFHNRNIGFRVVKTLVTMKKNCINKSACLEREELLPLSEINGGFIAQYKASVKLRKRNLTEQRIPTAKKLKYYNRLLHFRGRFSYCGPNGLWKWAGIGRRECKESTSDSFSIENCINMCCGFGYRVVKESKNYCTMTSKPALRLKCEKKIVTRFYCKYEDEARRRDIWNDPPLKKV